LLSRAQSAVREDGELPAKSRANCQPIAIVINDQAGSSDGLNKNLENPVLARRDDETIGSVDRAYII
jgi:hypothetical protein